MVRTRYAPSPTGYMHAGNLRTALYEYLVAKANNGKFILRIEDTDQNRLVDGSVEVIYSTLKQSGIQHDEGPDVGGGYGPYIQSQRKNDYLGYAKKLVETGNAYYCFCTKERLEALPKEENSEAVKYDRHCYKISKEEIEKNLELTMPYVIRQLIPEGQTTFHDEVFGDITVNNTELDDQVLIKADGMPTYNFANVIDDHLMAITHVIRGNEYLSSTPKYNLLYNALGWEIPTYIHLPLVLNSQGAKLSKRRGDATFDDLLKMGYLPEAIVNYCALLGWSPSTNQEIFTLSELEKVFDIKGLSKSPSIFDMQKLTWMNSEHIKRIDPDNFYKLVLPFISEAVKREDIDRHRLASLLQSRISFPKDALDMLDFIDFVPEYSAELYTNKKMKTDTEISIQSLKEVVPVLESTGEADFCNDNLYAILVSLSEKMGVKNSQVLWPVRTALSGKQATPCGASELLELLGKEESIKRIHAAIKKLGTAR